MATASCSHSIPLKASRKKKTRVYILVCPPYPSCVSFLFIRKPFQAQLWAEVDFPVTPRHTNFIGDVTALPLILAQWRPTYSKGENLKFELFRYPC